MNDDGKTPLDGLDQLAREAPPPWPRLSSTLEL